MKTRQHVLKDLSSLIYKIESEYPELYKFLDESPVTIPVERHPNIDAQALETYFEGLQQLLKEYKKTHLDQK